MNLLRALILGLVFFTGCARKATIELPKQEPWLRFATRHWAPLPDWNRCASGACARSASLLMSGLTRLDFRRDGPYPQPELAEKWEESPSSYTFQLRNVRWSNGTPLHIKHFITGWRELFKDCRLALRVFSAVKNAKAYCDGKASFHQLGFQIIDSRTLKMHLATPDPHLLVSLAHPVTWPRFEDRLTAQSPIIGPFEYLGENAFGTKYKKNPHYWQPLAVYGIDVRLVPSDVMRTTMLAENEVDLAEMDSRTERHLFSPDLTITFPASLKRFGLLLNTKSEKFAAQADRLLVMQSLVGGLPLSLSERPMNPLETLFAVAMKAPVMNPKLPSSPTTLERIVFQPITAEAAEVTTGIGALTLLRTKKFVDIKTGPFDSTSDLWITSWDLNLGDSRYAMQGIFHQIEKVLKPPLRTSFEKHLELLQKASLLKSSRENFHTLLTWLRNEGVFVPLFTTTSSYFIAKRIRGFDEDAWGLWNLRQLSME